MDTNRLWHWGSEHEIKCGSELVVSDEKKFVLVRNGDANSEELFAVVSSVILGYVRFDCRDLILLRSFRSSSPNERVLDDNCWNDATEW